MTNDSTRILVTLSDVTPNRATVVTVGECPEQRVNRETGQSYIRAQDYAVVTDPALVPVVGERVWIADGATCSRGERTITGRQ